MPVFRKVDPNRINLATGRHLRKGSGAATPPSIIPFSKVIVTAFLAYQVWGMVCRVRRGHGERGSHPSGIPV